MRPMAWPKAKIVWCAPSALGVTGSAPGRQPPRGHRRRTNAAEAGFTIIELFVSMFVFTAGMAGVLALQTAIIKHNSMSNDISLASNLAAAAIEQLRITRYDNIPAASTCPPVDPNNLSALAAAEIANEVCYFDKNGQVTAVQNRYFTRSWRAATDSMLNVKDVTVQVSWVFSVVLGGDASDTKTVSMKGRVYPR